MDLDVSNLDDPETIRQQCAMLASEIERDDYAQVYRLAADGFISPPELAFEQQYLESPLACPFLEYFIRQGLLSAKEVFTSTQKDRHAWYGRLQKYFLDNRKTELAKIVKLVDAEYFDPYPKTFFKVDEKQYKIIALLSDPILKKNIKITEHLLMTLGVDMRSWEKYFGVDLKNHLKLQLGALNKISQQPDGQYPHIVQDMVVFRSLHKVLTIEDPVVQDLDPKNTENKKRIRRDSKT